jgi:hypothetical protein
MIYQQLVLLTKDIHQATISSAVAVLAPAVPLLLLHCPLQSGPVGALVDADGRGAVGEGGGHSHKHLPHVEAALGRGLVVEEVLFVDELLDLLGGDLAFGVALVADEDEERVGVSVGLDLVDPVVADVEEGVAQREVEDEEDGVGVCVGRAVLL